MGYNKIWTLAEENFVLNDGGDSGVRTFKLKLKKPGEEVVTIVLGDMTKFDDAEDDYSQSGNNLFDLEKMNATQYTQV